MGLNILLAAKQLYPEGIPHSQVDCSKLVYDAMVQAGYVLPKGRFSTAANMSLANDTEWRGAA